MFLHDPSDLQEAAISALARLIRIGIGTPALGPLIDPTVEAVVS